MHQVALSKIRSPSLLLVQVNKSPQVQHDARCIFIKTHYIINSGSKAVNGTKAALGGATGATGKPSSQVQVIFNGKILTPQSLIQRKQYQSGGDGGHKKNKVDRGFVEKNETIDEDAPEGSDKPVLPTRGKR